MGKVTNAAVRAREQARARRLALDADRQAREDRIDAATAEVILAGDQITAARETRDAAVAAAQRVFDAAVSAADDQAGTAVAAAERQIGAAVVALAGEKLTGSRIAELTELSAGEVRRLSKLVDSSSTTVDA